MGKLRGFMEFDKLEEYTLDPKKRIKNYKEFTITPFNLRKETISSVAGRIHTSETCIVQEFVPFTVI